jgi:Cu(I)/Ag(I) efflux system protein CusF
MMTLCQVKKSINVNQPPTFHTIDVRSAGCGRVKPSVVSAILLMTSLLLPGVAVMDAKAISTDVHSAAAQHRSGTQHSSASQPHASTDAVQQPSSDVAQPWVKAEVKAIDPAQQRLTLKHAAMPEHKMPAMTMVFHVVDPALLQGLTVGQAIEAQFISQQGRLKVLRIRKN